jgi:hypothetical protein
LLIISDLRLAKSLGGILFAFEAKQIFNMNQEKFTKEGFLAGLMRLNCQAAGEICGRRGTRSLMRTVYASKTRAELEDLVV